MLRPRARRLIVASRIIGCPLLIVLVASLAVVGGGQLVIRACCQNATGGEGCKEYRRAEDLFGVDCCAGVPYNQLSQLCCAGAIEERRRSSGAYAEQCCGRSALTATQTCCQDVLHNVVGGICCGAAVYSAADPSTLCCNGSLTTATTVHDTCCGKYAYDGGRTQLCCGGQVYQKSTFDGCCLPNAADPKNGAGGTDGLQLLKPPLPFSTQTQFCCDTPQPKSVKACCYLRAGQGSTARVPTPYNLSTECCVYPFIQISNMPANGTCIS